MKNYTDSLEKLKQKIAEASSNPDFIHHPWFVDYHLKIVEQIAGELLAFYPEADKDLVLALVWIHDYGKTIDFDDQYNITLEEGPKLLRAVGYDDAFADKVIEYMEMADKKLEIDLHKAPIEVQIIASADGCSHYVGPFLNLWWWEHPGKDFKELMADNRYKIDKDWNRKIVLPEARRAFESRYRWLCQQSGELPDTLLS